MADLLIKPELSQSRIQHITPENAGWTYVGFEVYRLAVGEALAQTTDDQEVCIVILSGKADIASANTSWKNLGHRIRTWRFYNDLDHEWIINV